MLHREGLFDDGQRLAIFQCNAKFAVDLSGTHKVVGVGIHAGLDAEGDVRASAHLCGKSVQPLQLIVVVHHDQPYPFAQGILQLAVGLVVSVKTDSLCREARRKGRVQLAFRHHIQAHPLLVHEAADGLAAESLAGVADQSPAAVIAVDRAAVAAAGVAHARLIQHIQRGAVLLCKLQSVAPANAQMSLSIDL